MAIARGSISSFLGAVKKLVASPGRDSQNIVYVIGNESADLDSIISPLIYAYIKSQRPPWTIYIPITNLFPHDLKLRPELNAALSRAHVPSSDLITLADFAAVTKSSSAVIKDSLKFVLVDHNALTGALAQYAGEMVGCIDHHDDEKTVPANARPRIIEKSGSCCSLVVRSCQEDWTLVFDKEEDQVNDDEETARSSTQLAQLALAPILIDTANLTDEHKTTETDRSAVAFLKQRVQSTRTRGSSLVHPFDSDAYYAEIQHAKEDLDALSLDDIFRKDYKSWTENGIKLGTCAVVKDVAYLVSRSSDGSITAFNDAMRDFARRNELAVLGVMIAYTTTAGDFRRELLLWGLDERGEGVVTAFEKANAAALKLEPWDGGRLDGDNHGVRRCWMQGDLSVSRKQGAPLLRKAMAEA